MMPRLARCLRRFGRDENGAALMIEFVIFVPLIFGLFLMSVEMGIYSVRHMFLDRGVDSTVRFVRLNTNTDLKHNDLKKMICDNAGFLEDCDDTLRLEMVVVNPRSFTPLDQDPDCVDTSLDETPVKGFSLGEEHDMMVLRACVKFKPVFPTTGLGYSFAKDGTGRVRMVSTAAFVLEPN